MMPAYYRHRARRVMRSLWRLLTWIAMAVVSGGTVGGIVLSFLRIDDPWMGHDLFLSGAILGGFLGMIGGGIMGVMEWNGADMKRRKTAVGVGQMVGAVVFIVGLIPGGVAAWIAAYLMDCLEPPEPRVEHRFR